VKANRTGIEKVCHDYNEPTGVDKLPLGTQNEESVIEKTQLEEMHPIEDMFSVQMNTVRTKKLKTDREDPASKIRNRSNPRTRNAYNKSTQP